MQKCPKTFVLDCSVILAGKCGSHCHSTTSFSENVVVAETTYQILEVLSFCDQERAQPLSINITELYLLVNQKYNEAFQGECLFFENKQKNFQSNLVLIAILVLIFNHLCNKINHAKSVQIKLFNF